MGFTSNFHGKKEIDWKFLSLEGEGNQAPYKCARFSFLFHLKNHHSKDVNVKF